MRINSGLPILVASLCALIAAPALAQVDSGQERADVLGFASEADERTRSFDPAAPAIGTAPSVGALPTPGLVIRPDDRSEATEETAEDLFKSGASAYLQQDFGTALQWFERAADLGHPLAQWKLGRMYQEGDGVGANQEMAFKYYTDVARASGDVAPNSATAPFVAHALLTIGTYYLDGIEGTPITKDPARAHKILHYAASYYANAEAQFALGRIYFDGLAGRTNKRWAARWLKLSALKGHHKAQAMLGRMMFMGDGIPQRVSEGLMWLTLARERAGGKEDDWIRDEQERAFALATETERRTAMARADKWNSIFESR
ncbi:MAG: tetratricopeptide repeat protein [Pseudomonadota bacterium]